MMVILGEMKRWMRTPIIWMMLLIAVLMTVLSVYGCIQAASSTRESATAQLTLSELVSTMAFGGALFTSIIGILVVTLDVQSGYYRYLALKHSGFLFITGIKIGVAAMFAVLTAVINLLAAHWAASIMMKINAMTYTPPQSIWKWIATYAFIYVASAAWGVALGALVRNTVLSITVQFVYQTLAEARIISAFPKIGRWLFGGAESAVVDDTALVERFNTWQGMGLSVAWVALLLTLAYVVNSQSYGFKIDGLRLCGQSTGEDERNGCISTV